MEEILLVYGGFVHEGFVYEILVVYEILAYSYEVVSMSWGLKCGVVLDGVVVVVRVVRLRKNGTVTD